MTVSSEAVQQVPAALSAGLDTAVQAAVGYLRVADPDAAAELEELRHRRVTRASVVLVGAPRQGASSLLNALIGVPGLAPAATSAYLEFVPGSAAARAYVAGVDEPVRLQVADLADWASLLGRAVPGGRRAPRRVQVTHPAPLLESVSLVDTPGVVGMDAARTDVALDALGRASALLYVTDASAPLSPPELDFVARAGARVGSVLFALTKTDAHSGWRRVVAENQALLAAQVPRLAGAPWFAVSARSAEQAVTAAPGDAEALVQASGVAPLRQALVAVGAHWHEAQLANVLRGARRELLRLDLGFAARLRAVDPGPRDLASARLHRAELAARRRSVSRGWSSALSAQVQQARAAAVSVLHAELHAVQQRFTERIGHARGDDFDALPDDVDWALQAVAVRLSDELQQRFGQLSEAVSAQVFTAEDLLLVLSRLNTALRHAVSAAAPRDAADDDEVVALSAGGIALLASRGASVQASGAGAPEASGVVLPFGGVGAGLTAGGYVLWRHRVQADQEQALTWLREVLDAAGSALSGEVAFRCTDLRYALTVALDDAIEFRLRELDAHLAEIDVALAQDPASRRTAAAAVQAQRDLLRSQVAQVDEVVRQAQAR